MGSSPSVKLNAMELPPRAPGLSRTLVLLHGYGADERDLLPIAHELDPRLRAVSLQGPIALVGPMRAWFNLWQDAAGRISFDSEEARAAVRTVSAEVEEIAAHSPRPLLLGFSQGAGRGSARKAASSSKPTSAWNRRCARAGPPATAGPGAPS